MIDEIDELITNMQTLCNIADEDLVTEIATLSADILAELSAMLPPTLSRRKCRQCGKVAYHADSRTPYVCCGDCGSHDTRLAIRKRDQVVG